MNEESLIKRTLVFTGKLVGISAIWIALLSFVLLAVTDRVVLALANQPSDNKGAAVSSGTTKKDETKKDETKKDETKKDDASRTPGVSPAGNVKKPQG